jgi:DNA polymerase
LQTKEPIGRLRGVAHELQLDPMASPIPTICTYHPAYLLRNYTPDARRKVWLDIQEAMKIAGLPIPDTTR